jgi:hypothetical protein
LRTAVGSLVDFFGIIVEPVSSCTTVVTNVLGSCLFSCGGGDSGLPLVVESRCKLGSSHEVLSLRWVFDVRKQKLSLHHKKIKAI